MRKLVLFLFLTAILAINAQQPMNHNSVVEINESEVYFEEGRFLLKLHDEYAHIDLSGDGSGITAVAIPKLSALNLVHKVVSIKKLFPFVRKNNKNPHDLTTIYEIQYEDKISPIEISKIYAEISEVEFAEPDYIASILINPNDPYYKNGSQTYHSAVKANDAWELSTGDATQIISIIDTGVDWGHQDLADNMWINTEERDGTAGIDDDGNGFVDDIRGWDFVNNDNNPMDDNSHGTHVAGIAGAKTNNNLGIAGISWNSKLMAVKVMQSSGRGSYSHIAQGVTYSAENGSTVINMSLGGYTESLTLKYALENAYNKSVLVAAAGNDGLCLLTECPPPTPTAAMFPACYPWVLGVQAATSSGIRTSWSNYDPTGPTAFSNPFGYNYEVLAPGANIFSTIPNNGYRYLSGTSMATPITSGAVALIKSYLPNISTEELFARIIQASGSGVFDIEGAMTIELVPDIRLNKFSIVDTLDGCDRDGVADAGETVILNIEARNYGGLAQNVKAKIRFGEFEDTNTLRIDDSTAAFGNVSAYARVNNDANPFQLTISNDVSNDRDIVLQLEISNDTDDSKYFKTIIITAQNGEELKGFNPGLTHLTANRYYLLTENAVFDSLIIDPGVTINAYSNTNIGVGEFLKSDGKVDSLINISNNNNYYWGFFKNLSQNNIHLSYIKLEYIYLNTHNIDDTEFRISNSILKNSKMFTDWDSPPYDFSIASSIIYENIGSFFYGQLIKSIMTNNSTISYYPVFYQNQNQGFTSIDFNDRTVYFCSAYRNFKFNNRISSFYGTKDRSKLINELLPNHFGSEIQSDIDLEIYDYFENSELPITNCTNFLTEPHPEVHGHAWAILLNDENPYYIDLDQFGNETVKFDVFFSRSMDTSITPFLTFGVREPYTQKAVVDSARWVNWKRNSLGGDTYYHIQISADSTLSTIDFQKNDILGLDYQFDLEPDKHYYWRVRYKNGTNGEWQKWSDISNFWTKPSTAPNLPAIIHPKNGDDDLWTDFQVQWDQDPYSTGYKIQIDDDNTFASPIVNDSTHYLSNYYYVFGLTRGETYYLRVRTSNAYGTSDWSDVVSFEVVENNSRGPELISPVDSSLGISYITKFEWEDLDWATSYRFQISYDSNFTSIVTNQIVENQNYYVNSVWNSSFYWRVRGVRDNENSDYSDVFFFTGNNEPTEQNVTIISPLDSSKHNVGEFVSFKWENIFNVAHYNIEIYDSFTMLKQILSTSLNYPDSTFNYSELLNIGKYYWRIRVYGRNGWESWSKLYLFEVTKDLDPKPLLSVPTNNMKWYDTTLTFKWNNAPGANTVYNARWQAYHTMDFTTGDGLQMIRVAGAKDNEGFEIPVEWNRFQFEVQATAALSNDFIADGKVGKIELEWGLPDVERDILGFNMYRFVKKDSVTWGDTIKVNNILIVDTTYIDYDIIPDSSYYYVYRIVRTTLDEGEDSRMVSASAYPTVLDPPALLYPPADTTKLPINITFDWDEPSGATNYILQVARDLAFSNIVFEQESIESQYLASGLSNRTQYYWRVKAEGIQGTSVWSTIRKFTTIPVIPDVPQLTIPENYAISLPTALTLSWGIANQADSYQLQIATDIYFGTIINDISNITTNSHYISNLAINKTYFWRVRSKNDAGLSQWSAKWQFTTDTAGAALPPATWNFTDNTGNNAVIVIPKNINPRINGRDILPGDAIGVFYLSQGQYKSAGYEIWEGQNLAITVWGDDDQTTIKDGYAVNEKYILKLWDSRQSKEFFAETTFSSGPDKYTINGYSILGMLNSVETVTQNIVLKQGWNLISSNLSINQPDSMQYVWSNLQNRLVIMKNQAGKIYLPNSVNQIGSWNIEHGYQVYVNQLCTLSVDGLKIIPEQKQIPLNSGWSIVPYLRNSNQNIILSFVSLTDENRLVIAKNNGGKVYVPSQNINTIGNMIPGEGYQAYLNAKDTLIYPPNAVGRSSNNSEDQDFDTRNIKLDFENTGNNASLILDIDAIDNSEIAVMNNENKIVGASRVVDGRTVIAIWGKDELIDENNNSELKIMNYDVNSEKYSEINGIEFTDIITNKTYKSLIYNKDAVYVAKVITNNLKLTVNPNPFSNTSELVYELAEDCEIELSLFDLSGRKVLDLANGTQTKGTHKLTINAENLTSGTYNVILKSCGKSVSERVVVVK